MKTTPTTKVYTQFKVKKLQENKLTSFSIVQNHISWMQRQLEYAAFSTKYKLGLHCRRGEIYEIDWGNNINAEFSSRHYGIVLKDSSENNPLVLVCPLKTNKNGVNPYSDIDLGVIEGLNSENGTLAVYNQIRTIDKIRIYKNRLINNSKNNTPEDNVEVSSNVPVMKVDYKVVNDILDAYWRMIDRNIISR